MPTLTLELNTQLNISKVINKNIFNNIFDYKSLLFLMSVRFIIILIKYRSLIKFSSFPNIIFDDLINFEQIDIC